MRKELYDFYLTGDAERSKSFADLCFDIMDARYEEGMTVTAQKLLQYDVISEQFDPVIFRHNPFFYETGVLTSISDGAFQAKGLGFYRDMVFAGVNVLRVLDVLRVVIGAYC